MRSQLIFKFTHFLFHRFYPIYRALYFAFKGKQDAQEITLIKNTVKEGSTIIDVGANIGFYALLFSELTGKNGKVFCFEPDAYNYKRLSQTVSRHQNIIPKNAACGATTGTLEFYTSPDKNVDHRAYQPDTYATKYTVDCVCLDEIPGSNTKVSVLKVDVQGFEMQVYQGATGLLANNPDIKIFSEFWPYGLEKAGSSKQEYFDFFTERGFSVFLLKDGQQTLITKETLSSFPVSEADYFNVLIYRA